MPFVQAAFVYTVQLAIGCVHMPFNFLMMPHINVSMFLMCVYIGSRSCPTIKNFLAMPLGSQQQLIRPGGKDPKWYNHIRTFIN